MGTLRREILLINWQPIIPGSSKIFWALLITVVTRKANGPWGLEVPAITAFRTNKTVQIAHGIQEDNHGKA